MNTTVIIIMIIGATVIALVAIICDHCFERKSTDSYDCYMSKKIIKVHRNYIAGFLGFAVIMLITAEYGGPENAIFGYLSFGSTITSLVLSILAIFVTVQSSSDMYKQFTKIENATNTIKNASIQIDGTLAALKETESNLQNTSNGISSQFDNIVEKIKSQMKETEDNISRKLAESINNTPDINNQEAISNKQMTEKVKKYFVAMTSANGLLALYACSLSYEKGMEFELSSLFRGNESYIFGYLIASISAAIVQFTNDNNNNQISCHDSLYSSDELYEIIKERIEQQKLGVDFVKGLNTINDHFGLAPLKVTIE